MLRPASGTTIRYVVTRHVVSSHRFPVHKGIHTHKMLSECTCFYGKWTKCARQLIRSVGRRYTADIIKPVVINHVTYNRCRFSGIAILNAALIESRSRSLSICLHNRAARNYFTLALFVGIPPPGIYPPFDRKVVVCRIESTFP